MAKSIMSDTESLKDNLDNFGDVFPDWDGSAGALGGAAAMPNDTDVSADVSEGEQSGNDSASHASDDSCSYASYGTDSEAYKEAEAYQRTLDERDEQIVKLGLCSEFRATVAWIERVSGVSSSDWGHAFPNRFGDGDPLTNMWQWVQDSLIAGDKETIPFLSSTLAPMGSAWLTSIYHVWTFYPRPSVLKRLAPHELATLTGVPAVIRRATRASHRSRKRRAAEAFKHDDRRDAGGERPHTVAK